MSKLIIAELKVCKECGSENVRLLAWLEWNVDVQEWRLSVDGGEEDRFWCIDCDADIEIVTKQGGNDGKEG
jgi:hypothetical protein